MNAPATPGKAHPAKRRAVLRAALAPSRPMRVCDVGANPLSDPPYKPLLDDGLCHVFGFEPNPEAFEELQKAKSAQETYFKEAVGLPGDRTLYLHPWSGFSSLYPMDRVALKSIGKEKWIRPAKTREVPLNPVTLDMLADLPAIDLLKMDLQGGELEVLRGGIGKLSQTVAVVTEVRFHRIYENEPLFGDLDQELRRQGFKLHKFMFTKSVMMPHDHEDKVLRPRLTSQLLDGDAVYIRDTDWAETLTDDQLIYLALAADTVFDSPDMTLLCLDILSSRGQVPGDLAAEYIAEFPVHQLRKEETQ
ncbi:FkbM family methyltransferase [Rhodophyticola sp. CCM32]|uniref:FkbM family methyltransferase n=1 Tax=Rhodophyticola sp. CCM32 TaxID=2916397 RepID=UPI00107F94C8|nr:FkbM family methyltransferase [Rhodophyticola sp. CCM32]QBY00410.1 FkbM family methyltransferase [Rhodophyticola sp. CCM32]